MHILEKLWDELNRQPVHRFADWPNRDVPKGQPGVYLIYQGDRWIYIGMSFKNLQSRLNQHASGRRSGDQFCVYVSDRLVMKNLTDEQLEGISRGLILWIIKYETLFERNYLIVMYWFPTILPLGL